ncbi:MAG: hypothetical protein K6E76_02545 [Patescibacteria group bacterium]|nr:hypothetical protein [Patescibacteria group bacterium]
MKDPQEGQNLKYQISSLTSNGEVKKEVIDPKTTKEIIYHAQQMKIYGSGETISTGAKTFKLDDIKIDLSDNLNNIKINKIKLNLNGTDIKYISSIKLDGKTQDKVYDNNTKSYIIELNGTYNNGAKLPLQVTVDESIPNGTKFNFIIDEIIGETDSIDIQKNNPQINTVIINNPKATIKGEGKEKEGTLTDKNFNVGTLSFTLDGVEGNQANNMTIVVYSTGMSKVSNLYYKVGSDTKNCTMNGGNICTFNDVTITKGQSFTVEGSLKDAVSDNDTIYFTIQKFSGNNVTTTIETPDTTRSITYHQKQANILVKNATENIKTPSLTVDKALTVSLTGGLEKEGIVLKYIKVALEPTANAKYITSLELAGKSYKRDIDGTYLFELGEQGTKYNNGSTMPLKLGLSSDTPNQSKFTFKIAKVEAEGDIQPSREKEPIVTVTYNDPWIKLNSDNKVLPESTGLELNLGNLKTELNGINETVITSITLTHSGTLPVNQISSISLGGVTINNPSSTITFNNINKKVKNADLLPLIVTLKNGDKNGTLQFNITKVNTDDAKLKEPTVSNTISYYHPTITFEGNENDTANTMKVNMLFDHTNKATISNMQIARNAGIDQNMIKEIIVKNGTNQVILPNIKGSFEFPKSASLIVNSGNTLTFTVNLSGNANTGDKLQLKITDITLNDNIGVVKKNPILLKQIEFEKPANTHNSAASFEHYAANITP